MRRADTMSKYCISPDDLTMDGIVFLMKYCGFFLCVMIAGNRYIGACIFNENLNASSQTSLWEDVNAISQHINVNMGETTTKCYGDKMGFQAIPTPYHLSCMD